MPSPKQRRSSALPKHFPVGTVYVVEGRSGQSGRLRVSSRYLIMPGRGRIDLLGHPAPGKLDRLQDRAHSRGLPERVAASERRPAGTRIKARRSDSQKISAGPGTAA
jgi:hypothetical protein